MIYGRTDIYNTKRPKIFPLLIKIRKSFQNLKNIYVTGRKDGLQESLGKVVNMYRYKKQEEERKSCFCFRE